MEIASIRTIHDGMNPVAALFHSLFDGKFLLRHYSDCRDTAMVLDAEGNIIGEAHTLSSDAWNVQTRPFGGTVPAAQIVFVDYPRRGNEAPMEEPKPFCERRLPHIEGLSAHGIP